MRITITRDKKWGLLVWGPGVELEYDGSFWDQHCEDRGGINLQDVIDRVLPDSLDDDLKMGESVELEVELKERKRYE